jgi:hypothetical protein
VFVGLTGGVGRLEGGGWCRRVRVTEAQGAEVLAALKAVVFLVQVVVLLFAALVGGWFAWRFIRG